ncbi:MAG: hypothetical protein IT259_19830 [Saprospiraceae bacterium]|nr:hypothetical protein [Saprospiraceae bacterium]
MTVVQVQLHPEMTIAELSQSVHSVFPFLKIECFTAPHDAFEGSQARFMVKDHDTPLSKLNPGIEAGMLEIRPDITVRNFEADLESRFGLNVQIFRKSHQVWLATSVTDHLTLAEQNRKGETAEHPDEMTDEPLDYREQD